MTMATITTPTEIVTYFSVICEWLVRHASNVSWQIFFSQKSEVAFPVGAVIAAISASHKEVFGFANSCK